MSDEKLKKVAAALPEKVRALANYPVFKLGKNAMHKVQEMLEVVFQAALNSTSVEIISALKKDSPSADTIRGHIGWKLSIAAVEGMMKDRMRWLATLLKRRFGGRRFAIAMDYTDEPYYGEKSHGFAVGTKPKNGTAYAYKYFTASIVIEGARIFLFCYPVVDRSIPHVFFINRSLLFMKELGIKPHLLLLDREFNTVDVFALLEEEALRFIIPADHGEKFMNKMKLAKEFPAIFRGWQITNADKETVYVDLVALERFDKEGKRIFHGFFPNLPEKFYKDGVEWLARQYSRRWGIETAHSEQGKFRIKTSSVNGIAHCLFFVVGVLLYNMWVELNLRLCNKASEFFIRIRMEQMRRILICMIEPKPG